MWNPEDLFKEIEDDIRRSQTPDKNDGAINMSDGDIERTLADIGDCSKWSSKIADSSTLKQFVKIDCGINEWELKTALNHTQKGFLSTEKIANLCYFKYVVDLKNSKIIQ